ncbi:hypothetical protein F383_37912 [Gossypium arboreum]|uniref:Uncharacterized protein n=1 Tax=Gossypium arboreum TaxID=29729 RepID=A0A0B0MD41_GOSAR|nr:hypothetical protein F383_37912 [Gossypium arboreum]
MNSLTIPELVTYIKISDINELCKSTIRIFLFFLDPSLVSFVLDL